MEILIELANAGVEITVYGPYSYNENWRITAMKASEGTEIKVQASHTNLSTAIHDVYKRYVHATSYGVPELTLRQIEHIVPPAPEYMSPPSLNDEIPF